MRFSSGLRAQLVLSALIAAVPFANAVHVILGGVRPVLTARLDPIVNPGQLAGHMHTIFGGNGFRNTYSHDQNVKESTCSTTVIPQDKSNYWTPSMYYHDPNNGSYTMIPSSMNIYYLVRGADTGDKVVPPPKGLVMLAGDTNRRTFDPSKKEDQAISYVCLDYSGQHNGDPAWAERNNFFEHNCPNGMRAQVFFPSCWDGKNLDSPDHKSHMSYPASFNNGKCPSTHPVHIISIFYEMILDVQKFPYNGPGTWVFSNGDTTGYGFHGDFANGWADLGLIDQLINNCPNAQGNIDDCPALKAVKDSNAASACRYTAPTVDEPTGEKFPLATLPGCNAPWDGKGTKPQCTAPSGTPGMIDTIPPLSPGWSNVGCISEPNNGRALTGAQLVDSAAMTINKCADFCASKGFTYAGVEWGQECYCGNSFSNGASNTPIASSKCGNSCAGNSNQICGGSRALTLLYNPKPGNPAPPSLPSTTPTPPAPVPTSSKPATSTVPPPPPPPSSTPTTTKSATVPVPTPTGGSCQPGAGGPSALPSGWHNAGCVSDNDTRGLNAYSFVDVDMSAVKCITECNKRGFTMAGIEYGTECYCGNSFKAGTGLPLDDGKCNMITRSGDNGGGAWAMSLYKADGLVKRQAPKLRHFGRNHHHARHHF